MNAAIAACGTNQYVKLGPGTFNLTTGLVFANHSNGVLRGSGANQTFTIFTGANGCSGAAAAAVCFISGDINYWGSPSNIANWTAGYSAGSTTLTLSSVTNLKVGFPITLDQQDDTVDTGDIFVCYTPKGTCSTNGDNGGQLRAGRSQQQIVTVTQCDGNTTFGHACSSGANITIAEPIIMPNWTSGKSPQAWWSSSPIFNVGVEDMSIDATSSGGNAAVTFFNCDNCWMSGVRTIGPTGRSHVQMWQSIHITAQNGYHYRTNDSASVNYGIETDSASFVLIQNNIFQQIQAPYPTDGSCAGCVMAYNFGVNNVFNPTTFLNQDGFPHAPGDDHMLYEGNQGVGVYSDNFHGTHQFQTLFRNNYNGFQLNEGATPNSGLGALKLNAYSRFYNVIGNVLGSSYFTGAGKYYRDDITSGYPNNSSIVTVGLGDAVPNDTNTARTLMMWGNYDTVTAAARWCGDSGTPGFSSPPCSGVSEVPYGIGLYPNAVPTSEALPPSFYLPSGRPSWFGSTPWPAVGPDVTGGTISGLGGHAYPNPAAACYAGVMGGPADGTGAVLSFNAAACYGGTVITYAWTLITTGSGSVSGTNSTSGTYASGTTIGPLTASASVGHSFSGWSSVSGSAACSGATTPCPSFNLGANSSATANFTVNTYTLSSAITGTGAGGVACAPTVGTVAYGTSLSCTATAAVGSTLTSFAGCGLTGGSTLTGTMPAGNCAVTANFTVNTYTLSSVTAGTGTGNVTCTPAVGTVAYGTALSCTAAPTGGSTLAAFSGCGLTGGSMLAGTMPAGNCAVTATFSLVLTTPNISNVLIARDQTPRRTHD